MGTTKFFTLATTSLVLISLLLFLIKIAGKQMKIKTVDDNYKTSFVVFFSAVFIAGLIITSKVLSIIELSIDNLNKMQDKDLIYNTIKSITLSVGIGSIWFVIWFFASNFISVIILGKRKPKIEMEQDTYFFFIVHGLIFVGLIYLLLPVLEGFLSNFVPSVQMPIFYN